MNSPLCVDKIMMKGWQGEYSDNGIGVMVAMDGMENIMMMRI